MEAKIISLLEFDLARPSPLVFYERYSKVIKMEEKPYFFGRYLLELVLLESKFTKYQPSM
jgi:hypothetical protein